MKREGNWQTKRSAGRWIQSGLLVSRCRIEVLVDECKGGEDGRGIGGASRPTASSHIRSRVRPVRTSRRRCGELAR